MVKLNKIIIKPEKLLNNFYLRALIALILFYSMIWDIGKFTDLKYLLWSCDLMSILLITNLLIFNKLEIYLFIFLITFSSTIEWIIDFFKMLLGLNAPKTAWMINSDDNLIFTELQHGIIMVVPFVFLVVFLVKNWKKEKEINRTLIKLSIFAIIYYFSLAFFSYYLSINGFIEIEENINCVLRACGSYGGIERDLLGLIFYVLHYVKNVILLDLIIIFGLKIVKNLKL